MLKIIYIVPIISKKVPEESTADPIIKKVCNPLFIIGFVTVLSILLNIGLLFSLRNPSFHLLWDSGDSEKSKEMLLIDSNIQKNEIIHYSGLRSMIEHEISLYGPPNSTGVFVQDVKTGSWAGINERMGFPPASLLKIPIMLAVFKEIEQGELNFKDTLEIMPSDVDTLYGDLDSSKVGNNLSVQNLLEEMIVSSDNTAKNVFRRKLSMTEIDTVFKHVGINNPYLALGANQTVSPRDYTRLFRALYYSSFLTPELSQKALELTIDTQEEELIPAGVPYQVQVAHKFGIYDPVVLSDCGIVYHATNPYFICIMTEGVGIENSTELIRKISRDVYDFVDQNSN